MRGGTEIIEGIQKYNKDNKKSDSRRSNSSAIITSVISSSSSIVSEVEKHRSVKLHMDY